MRDLSRSLSLKFADVFYVHIYVIYLTISNVFKLDPNRLTVPKGTPTFAPTVAVVYHFKIQ